MLASADAGVCMLRELTLSSSKIDPVPEQVYIMAITTRRNWVHRTVLESSGPLDSLVAIY
jgi:hypothetical protein